MIVYIEAEKIEEQDGSMLLRLKTGFGTPELRVDTARVRTTDAPHAALLACFTKMTKDGIGLSLTQQQEIEREMGFKL